MIPERPVLYAVVPGICPPAPRPRAQLVPTMKWVTMAGKIRACRSMQEVRGLFRAHIYIPTDQGYREFQRALKWEFEKVRLAHCGKAPFVEKGEPVEVRILVVMPLSKSHHRKTRTVHRSWCVGKNRGDPDNLEKGILDAGTDILWHDDSQVAALNIEKITGAQGEPERTEIMIWPLDNLASERTNFEQCRKEIRLSGGLVEAE